MKKFRIVSIVSLIIFVMALSGCGSKEDALFDAIEKTQNIKAYSFKVDGAVKVNLPEEQQQNPFVATMTNVNFSATGKATQERNKWAKTNMNLNMGMMGVNVSSNLMVDVSYGDEYKYKAFIEIPEIVKQMGLQQMIGDAKYLYIDSDSMKEIQSADKNAKQLTTEDMAKIQKDSMDIQNDLIDFTKKYSKKHSEFINDEGKKDVEVNGKTEKANVYEIKLNNENLKDYLKEYLSDEKRASKLEDMFNIMKKYSVAKGSEDEIDKFNVEEIKKNIDKMPNFIGKDGITLEYSVKDGYVIKSKININIDIEDKSKNEVTGVSYVVTADLFDINDNIKVEIPNKKDVKCVDINQLITPQMLEQK
ncbi:hypothetical protein CLTEP_23580 [Clostridium tepidiprofundi DSM 19306]|uniref:Lipoprotein n=1 Tax=Clostridium tepidiprofundi DSM 19306 TaxID=1121338 RepID=A0A151AVA0_9CLOT|nr:hypothetical protein [Clostridium tepidiprofundi]KYH31575.1 hypothetical protein CLTEP_23580 [Clostridium tepidiprofundi DSM 19306]